ncbi:hypothetical protein SPSIL_029330 [Sporomusa silvacetica DSM 10669]|uniref:2TM domain-containing protein n=1 Tax=Sporomusa silvacetica DSM 10669 TaxID=1123289 RepID=A0ABZ3IMV1_9FIRM|nr:hypothetical protein [Sporomusa silvacetica]OZC15717.1 hypothetical protein SPSIL_40470 [Sporomusa silvacetica DSM 10669]
MHWLLMRPAIGWGAFLLIHALGIPAVYGLGKRCAEQKGHRQKAAGEPMEESEGFMEH